MEYKKTDDPNVVKQIETVESEIHLDKLEKQIVDLEARIANCITVEVSEKYPDEVNQIITIHKNFFPEKVNLETELKEKQDLLTMLKGL